MSKHSHWKEVGGVAFDSSRVVAYKKVVAKKGEQYTAHVAVVFADGAQTVIETKDDLHTDQILTQMHQAVHHS
jgi:hypothetical protein